MHLENVKQIFSEALELPAAERLRFLSARIGNDRVTFEQIQSLLAAREPGRRFFARLDSILQVHADDVPLASPGELVASRFMVIRFMASGSMGEVYEARDSELSVHVALKFLKPRLVRDAQGMQRFRDEIRIAREVNHPNVCRIFDLGQRIDAEGRQTLFYAMELLEGETVSARVRRAGGLPVADAQDVARQLAAGLEAIHAANVLHRDVSSGNVLLCRQPDGSLRVVLTDFGLAVRSDLISEAERGVWGGTLAYTAPEQLDGAIPSVASDVYAFGAVLYELMTGKPPASSPGSALQPPGFFRSGFPKTWDTVVLKCLEHRGVDRFPTIASAAKALEPPDRKVARRWFIGAATCLMASAASGIGIEERVVVSPHSIAVAQFIPADPALAYLASGITGRMIDTLTEIPGLRVVGSAVRDKVLLADFSGLQQSARVRALLMGEIARSDLGYRIRTHLVDLNTRYDLWSQSFEVGNRDMERINQPVANAVIKALGIPLATDASHPPEKALTQNAEAWEAYLLGAYYAEKRDPDSLARAVGSYRRATDLDPLFARAFGGLAAALNLAAIKPLVPDFIKAEESSRAAERALVLDPSLGEAEAVLGSNEQWFRWNWAAAESHYRRAIQLSPASIVAHHWYSNLLSLLGRHSEALHEVRVARDLDPISPVLVGAEGAFLVRAGQHRQAVDQLSWAVRTHPEYVNAYILFAMALSEDRQLEEALIIADRSVALTGGASFTLAARGHYLARLGRLAEANQVLNELMVRRDASPTLIAEVYKGLRDANAVFFWLNKAIEQHDVNMTLLVVDRANVWLRSDPRFTELRQKMHLPEINN